MRTGQILVVGCGNLLFGDDGFGPGVIECLKAKYQLPDGVEVIDAGTSAGDLLLDALLGERGPKQVILIDAIDLGLKPGTVKEIDLEEIPLNKRDDFSVHQFPSLDILKKLRDSKSVDVRFLGCQVESIPEEICQGLSDSVAHAVLITAEAVVSMVS
ncbi:hydrogenase maturation protease [Desulfosporosinus sp. Sb-LF]|uniref:hydrogenase maturation protease n=1 Tax=Desulfosporosinus sp. Sb-LF TaxID=2560027 RepID=UPI00107F0BB5|nr:hydrogenase maturation protease [Desulfosporosinus sp. Sb-LF]TGE31106.1 hydrogenase maturation protease [Desulfosporosinus sp. Sb-LF]